MAKRKLFATTKVAKDITFDCPISQEGNYPFTVRNTVVKRDVNEDSMERIKEPSLKDLTDEDVHVFCFLDIKTVDEIWLKDMQVLNKMKFQDVIELNADGTFSLKDGAVISVVGKEVTFELV